MSDVAMLLASGIQLEVAKRILVTAAQKVALDHSAALVLCGIG